jgi:hypothetical protein
MKDNKTSLIFRMEKRNAPKVWITEVGALNNHIEDLEDRLQEHGDTIELLVHQKEIITAILRNTADTIDNMEPNPAALALVVQIDDFLMALKNNADG